jgi:nitrate reductase (NAD(P)H)
MAQSVGWIFSETIAGNKSSSSEKEFTLEELSKHDKSSDAWVVINNKVYDVTSVLDWHPGGKNAIMNFAGKATMDATLQYTSIHDDYADGKREESLLGNLSDKAVDFMKKDAERAEREREMEDQKREKFGLQKHYWTPSTLEKVDSISRNTKRYTFRYAAFRSH